MKKPQQDNLPPGPAITHGQRLYARACCLRLELGHRFKTRTLYIAPLILALSGCTSQAVVVPEVIHEKTFIPYPATLTIPIIVDLTGATWGSGIASLNAALQTCDARLDAIRTLVPPPAKPPINP